MPSEGRCKVLQVYEVPSESVWIRGETRVEVQTRNLSLVPPPLSSFTLRSNMEHIDFQKLKTGEVNLGVRNLSFYRTEGTSLIVGI